jgi:uncharacterized membrane protein
LADVGIDDDFIREVREKVTEGTSALFALTSGAPAPDKVIDELKQYDFEIISTNLPEEQENQTTRGLLARRVVGAIALERSAKWPLRRKMSTTAK